MIRKRIEFLAALLFALGVAARGYGALANLSEEPAGPVSVDADIAPLPRDTVFRYVVVRPDAVAETDPGADSTAPAAGLERLIYSNTRGNYRVNLPANALVSDDIATTAPDGCHLSRFRFPVLGKVFPAGLAGPYSVKYALYSSCPRSAGSTSDLWDLLKIPGTSGALSFEDDAPRLIEHVVDPDNPVPMPTNLYLGLRFNRSNCGTVMGAPAMVGFSSDYFDSPISPCSANFGYFPTYPHASFWLELFGGENCPDAFPGYKSNRPSGNPLILGGNVQGVDDIQLSVADCQMVSYEVAVKGVGFYSFDLRRACDGQLIPGTEKTFLLGAGAQPQSQIARFRFDPPIPLSDQVFLGFKVSSSSSGAVNSGLSPAIGDSAVDYFVIDGATGQCVPRIPGGNLHGAVHAAVTCAGTQPTGACCDMALTQCVGGPDDGKSCPCNFVCQGEGGNGLCCNANSWCGPGGACEPYCAPPGTCEPVCRDVPKMNCPASLKLIAHPEDMWVQDASCAQDPFVPACGVAACCKTDDTCANLTESQCMATADRDDVVFWWETLYCESPGLECLFNVCRDPHKTGDCSIARDDAGCSGYTGRVLEGNSATACCQVVCEEDWWCCNVAWDRLCVQRASDLCMLYPSFDQCADSSDLRGPLKNAPNSTTYFTNLGASEGASDPGFCCNADAPGSQGYGSVWLKFVAEDESIQIDACPSDPEGDSLINVFAVGDPTSEQTACASLSLIGCQDNGGCPDGGTHSRFCVAGLTPGATYYIMLASKTPEAKGSHQIELTSPCPPLAKDYASALFVPPTVGPRGETTLEFMHAGPAQNDCNANGVFDSCDLAFRTSFDCNLDGFLDECEDGYEVPLDCNVNNIPDVCDIIEHVSDDCQGNGVPDECDLAMGSDCDSNGVPDECLAPMLVSLKGMYPYEIQKITALSMADNILAVAAVDFDVQLYAPSQSIYLFKREGREWRITSRLGGGAAAASVTAGAGFVAAGIPYDSSRGIVEGAVRIFSLRGGLWFFDETLFSPEPMTRAEFGRSVASAGRRVAVSAPFAGAGSRTSNGAVFVFRKDPEGWVWESALLPPEISPLGYFGETMDMDDATLIVGAINALNGLGAAYVYRRIDTVWEFDGRFEPPSDERRFGSGVSVSGDRIAVTSIKLTDDIVQGILRLYRRGPLGWYLEQMIPHSDPSGLRMGPAVTLEGNLMVAAAKTPDSTVSSLLLFEFDGSAWIERARLPQASLPNHVDLRPPWLISDSSAPACSAKSCAITTYVFSASDCNANKLPDACEAVSNIGSDCNHDGFPDECSPVAFADVNFDDHFDLLDLAGLQRCFAGQGEAISSCCGIFDSVPSDGDADLADFAAFVKAMTGP